MAQIIIVTNFVSVKCPPDIGAGRTDFIYVGATGA